MIGETIKLYRQNKHLSLRKLAINSNVSASYLHYIESGKCKNPSIDILTKLSTALGVSISELLDEGKKAI